MNLITDWNNLIKQDIILVKLNDNLDRIYNAIIIKYDNNKNVLVRYLDNPYQEDSIYWTGNKEGKYGLDPNVYKSKIIGDDEESMENLNKNDFVEDGNDDIINFNENRFFYKIADYPYLNGKNGNIFLNKFFRENYYNKLKNNEIPECILNKIAYDGKEYLKRIKCGKNYLQCLIEYLPKDFNPIIEEYEKTHDIELLKDFSKYLSLLITNNFIKKYSNIIKLSEKKILKIKEELKNGYINEKYELIIPYLIKYKVIIFYCYDDDYQILEKGEGECIYIIKYNNKYDVIF